MQRNLSIPDFSDWFATILAEQRPDLLVGIARGAIRLLQVHGRAELTKGLELLSQSALPFIPDKGLSGKKVLLFDDSVVYGSTLAEIREYLRSRGATVSCAAYAVDRVHFFGERLSSEDRSLDASPHARIPIEFKHRLTPDQLRRHHAVVVRSLLASDYHYNLDFPTIRIPVPSLRRGDIPSINSYLRGSGLFESIVEVSSPHAVESGTNNFTAFLRTPVWRVFRGPLVTWRHFTKVRLDFRTAQREIQLTALPQLLMSDAATFETVAFVEPSLNALWRGLIRPNSPGDPYYAQALFRLATSVAALVMEATLGRELTTHLASAFQVGDATLLNRDLPIILGAENASALAGAFEGPLRSLPLSKVCPPGPTQPLLVDEPSDSVVFQAVRDLWEHRAHLRPVVDDTTYEGLTKLFLSLRAVTDSPEIRHANPSVSRIDVGFGFSTLARLLREECGWVGEEADVSLGTDVCVDGGQAVPKVVRLGSAWLRVFYSGENEDDQGVLQFKAAIHNAYGNYLKKKNAKRLNSYQMHKLCATLKDVCRWLPISTRFNTFGRYSMLGQEELIESLTRPDTGPLVMAIATDEREGELNVNSSYRSPVAPTWSAHEARDFLDGFQYVAEAYRKLRDPSHVLLLSTCRTQRHTYNAVAVEAHHWAMHEQRSFRTFLAGIRLGGDEHGWVVTNDAIASLYYSAIYLDEAAKKYHVFHRGFERGRDQLEKAFVSQGGAAANYWRYMIVEAQLLDSARIEEIEDRFGLLLPILQQMRWLTAYATAAFAQAGVLPKARLEKEFGRRSAPTRIFQWLLEASDWAAAAKYNEPITAGDVTGASIIRTTLAADASAVPPFELVALLSTAYSEVLCALETFCPKYDVAEGDFAYAPDSRRRLLADGTDERFLPNQFILTLDIIKSTDSAVAAEFKTQIVTVLDSFKQRTELYYDTSGNDAFVVCGPDPVVLWDIAKALAIAGRSVRRTGDAFGGTRKGLSRGSVTVQLKTDGRMIVKDSSISMPHPLPRAVGILAGADKCAGMDGVDVNDVLVMEVGAGRLAAKDLKLEVNDDCITAVEAKHLKGRCFLVHLFRRELIRVGEGAR